MAGSLFITFLSVLVCIIGNALNSVGFIVEKIAHRKIRELNDKLPENEHIPYVKNKLWIGGFVTYGVGSVIIALALSFGPQSLLVPLESITLICNTYLAAKFLGEPLRRRDLVATGILLCFCCACARVEVCVGGRSSS